ncbi:MAG: NAD-dependent epimerase/dehydratase family protein [Acidobacteria bacterium]|nr:NAD-dependent epimerase/dehydratase family protein [Acidobacteriota bacterium]
MKVLVTGGTGVIGNGLIPALKLAGAERIRLLSRHALDDVSRWEGVEPYPGDITDSATVGEAAENFDVVVHVAGVEEENPPEVTFEEVNVHGTELIVSECERAGVRKLIFISTLKANDPATEYQRSKRKAEEIVRKFSREWVILRPSAIYGPGDRHVTTLLEMIRTFPAIPVIADGSQCIQPVWYEDMGNAIVRAIESEDVNHVTLPLGGHRTTVRELIAQLGEVAGKQPRLIPIPPDMALTGASIAEFLGIDLPVGETQLRLVLQESCIDGSQSNALVGIFGIEPIDLRESLKILAQSLPEQTPDQGVGALRRKIFSAEMNGPAVTAETLFQMIRRELPQLMPLPFKPSPDGTISVEKGATLTAELGVRGTIQLRVEELEPNRFTLVTIEGHPLAGAIRFLTETRPGGALIRLEVYARPSDLPHWLAMKAGSDQLQSDMWRTTMNNIVARSGGLIVGKVTEEEEPLDDHRGVLIEEWVERIVSARQREEEV